MTTRTCPDCKAPLPRLATRCNQCGWDELASGQQRDDQRTVRIEYPDGTVIMATQCAHADPNGTRCPKPGTITNGRTGPWFCADHFRPPTAPPTLPAHFFQRLKAILIRTTG